MTTDKESCNILSSLLVSHGVRHVVLSPGSRNTPLIVALTRNNDLTTRVVIDERSAAFVALGIAEIEQAPVAIVCTSGSALLNYAPALSEAYYRNIPLIAISADRPPHWIDQDDSQTIRQPGALSNIVKRSVSVKAEVSTPVERRVVERTVSDALIAATTGRRGPVHINVSIDEPLSSMTDCQPLSVNDIEIVEPSPLLPIDTIRELAKSLSSPARVMILGGNYPPSQRLNRALSRLATYDNIVVMCENLTNLHGKDFIDTIDTTLTACDVGQLTSLPPDIIISFGGAQVSGILKNYLRNCHAEHWSVGVNEWSIDTYMSLTKRINTRPEYFFSQLASTLRHNSEKSDYAKLWHKLERSGEESRDSFLLNAPWSDLKAFEIMMTTVPKGWNLQLSNGMSIRYSQLFDPSKFHRVDCNRGVSGIDGCTSTAIGASLVYNGMTLFVTGDMSAQYDIGALAMNGIPARFKMVVMCNGGGDIFRYIKTTSGLPELEDYFACKVNLPLKSLAEAYGFSYHEAVDRDSLERAIKEMAAEHSRPSILAVFTSPEVNADTMRSFINRNKTITSK